MFQRKNGRPTSQQLERVISYHQNSILERVNELVDVVQQEKNGLKDEIDALSALVTTKSNQITEVHERARIAHELAGRLKDGSGT